uniref:Interleukin-15 receptor subunit alpha n=1 Tax=Equus asinus asinus TaxID=83772 RepID=A0A8C4MKV9_EQUAS
PGQSPCGDNCAVTHRDETFRPHAGPLTRRLVVQERGERRKVEAGATGGGKRREESQRAEKPGITCPTPTSVEHADIRVKSYNLSSKERYICNSGFKRKAGTSSLTECVLNKTTNLAHWTTPNLKCISVHQYSSRVVTGEYFSLSWQGLCSGDLGPRMLNSPMPTVYACSPSMVTDSILFHSEKCLFRQ